MVTVVVPAYNEERDLRQAVLDIVTSAKKAGNIPVDIIIVNDASTDRTGEIVRELEKEYPFVRGVHQETNKGLVVALKEGLRLAKYDRLTMLPGDAAVHPYTMENIFRNAHKAELVLAYVVNTESRSPTRVALSSLFTRIHTIVFGVHIRYINGVPVYSVDRLRKMDLKAERYSMHAELQIKLLRQGVSFIELDGYLKPENKKSSAIYFNSFVEVARSFLRLVYEVYVRNPEQYRGKARRVYPYDEV